MGPRLKSRFKVGYRTCQGHVSIVPSWSSGRFWDSDDFSSFLISLFVFWLSFARCGIPVVPTSMGPLPVCRRLPLPYICLAAPRFTGRCVDDSSHSTLPVTNKYTAMKKFHSLWWCAIKEMNWINMTVERNFISYCIGKDVWAKTRKVYRGCIFVT